MATVHLAPKEDYAVDDSISISQLTSKLPTPPPRPASVGSSRSGSRRSSVASSFMRQSRHFDAELGDAPPTPSIAGIYTSGSSTPLPQPPIPSLTSPRHSVTGRSQSQQTTLAEEMAAVNSMDSGAMSTHAPSTSHIGSEKSSGNVQTSRNRLSNRTSQASSSTSSRRKAKRDGPSIVIGIRPGSPPIVDDRVPSISSVAEQQGAPSPEPVSRPVRPERIPQIRSSANASSHDNNPGTSARGGAFQNALLFISQFMRACAMLWTQIVWPLALGAVHLVLMPVAAGRSVNGEDGITKSVSTKVDKGESQSAAADTDNTFAERFKHIICTSSLLTNSLSISLYKDPATGETQENAKRDTAVPDAIPAASLRPRSIKCLVADDVSEAAGVSTDSTVRMTRSGSTLLNSGILSLILLVPYSSSRDVWLRSALLIGSLIWGLIASIGVQTCETMHFDVSHEPNGVYRLGKYDEILQTDLLSDDMSATQRTRIRDTMCDKAKELINDCKKFDVECNKALNAVQETELVSRGYKLSHPLPPISRIEMANYSPPRLRNGTLPLSRVSSPQSAPASMTIGRGWGAQKNNSVNGTMPNSIANAVSSPTSSAMGPPYMGGSQNEGEGLQLMALRKRLLMALEEASHAMTRLTDDMSTYGDQTEMGLLREMYELDYDTRSQSPLQHRGDEGASIDSSLQRRSWASRPGAASDTTRPSSTSQTIEDQSAPGTPVNATAPLVESQASVERKGSLRNGVGMRGSGIWDGKIAMHGGGTNSIRSSARLSYISDKAPMHGPMSGPNQSGALKRLSYNSNGSASSSALPYRTSLQPAPRINNHSKRQSLAHLGALFDESRSSSPSPQPPPSVNDRLKIASLKSAFEEMHCQRRKALCQLLALDFSLRPEVKIDSAPYKSSAKYWYAIRRAMSELSAVMASLAQDVKHDVQHELGLTFAKKEETTPTGLPTTDSQGHLIDYSGFEDRLIAMGEALRTVQIKMRLSANDMRMRSPPLLHGEAGEGSLLPGGSDASHSSETTFSSIRDDLLTLSAEWESALKIMRTQSLAQQQQQQPTATGGTMSNSSSLADVSTVAVNGLPVLDSPQEAEEDAMRAWVKSKKGSSGTGDDTIDDAEVDENIRQLIERGMVTWNHSKGVVVPARDSLGNVLHEGPDESSDSDRKVQEDLSTLLLHSTMPQYLPAPGAEKVYEDVAMARAQTAARSTMSREERIRLIQEERARRQQQQQQQSAQPTSLEMQNGMIEELQSVMKNRKSLLEAVQQQQQQRTADASNHNGVSERPGAKAIPASYDENTKRLNMDDVKKARGVAHRNSSVMALPPSLHPNGNGNGNGRSPQISGLPLDLNNSIIPSPNFAQTGF